MQLVVEREERDPIASLLELVRDLDHRVARAVPLAADMHAAARIEHDGYAHIGRLGSEVFDLTEPSGVKKLEVLSRQTRDRSALLVLDDDAHGHEIDARLERQPRNRRCFLSVLRMRDASSQCANQRKDKSNRSKPRHTELLFNSLASEKQACTSSKPAQP